MHDLVVMRPLGVWPECHPCLIRLACCNLACNLAFRVMLQLGVGFAVHVDVFFNVGVDRLLFFQTGDRVKERISFVFIVKSCYAYKQYIFQLTPSVQRLLYCKVMLSNNSTSIPSGFHKHCFYLPSHLSKWWYICQRCHNTGCDASNICWIN